MVGFWWWGTGIIRHEKYCNCSYSRNNYEAENISENEGYLVVTTKYHLKTNGPWKSIIMC